MADLDSELSGDFRNLLLDLMRLPWERELQALISSMAGVGTNESLLVHVLLAHDALVSFPVLSKAHRARGLRGDWAVKKLFLCFKLYLSLMSFLCTIH